MLSSKMLSQMMNGATLHHQQYKDTLAVNTYYRKSLLLS
jgi:hypothetical protein